MSEKTERKKITIKDVYKLVGVLNTTNEKNASERSSIWRTQKNAHQCKEENEERKCIYIKNHDMILTHT